VGDSWLSRTIPETSGHGPLAAVLDAADAGLTLRTRYIIGLRQQGVGLPDADFFTADQLSASAEVLRASAALGARLPRCSTRRRRWWV